MAGLVPAWIIISAALLLTKVEAKLKVLSKVLALADPKGATRLLQRLVFPSSPLGQKQEYSIWQMD